MTETARVSTGRGLWSVVLALLWPVLGFIVFFKFGFDVSRVVAPITLFTMLPAALFLGITSIVYASRQTARPGRTEAIVLGWIGTVLSVLIGFPSMFLWLQSLLQGTL